MRLNAEQERIQQNAVIIVARQVVYTAVICRFSKEITIGNIAELVTKGTTPKTYGFEFTEEGTPFLRAEDVLDGKILYEKTPFHIDAKTNDFMKRSRTQPGDVLVTIAGTIGRAAVIPPSAPELNMNQAVALIRCNNEKVDPYFLYHMLQSRGIQEQISGSTVTSAISNLSLSKIKQLIIPYAPLFDQISISQFLEAIRQKDRWDNLSRNLPDYVQHVPKIVARIEELASRIEEARGLRQQSLEESKLIVDNTIQQLFNNVPMQDWNLLPLGDVCEINPSKRKINLTDDIKVTFVPMSAVDGITGTISKAEIKPYGEVKRGYKYFEEGDIIFARITPCMENGKAAVASNLLNQKGFGSTEFHVLRPKDNLNPYYLHKFVRRSQFRRLAKEAFKGTAGQQRVPASFFATQKIPVPQIDEQHRIVAYLDNLQSKINSLRQLQEETAAELDALLPSVLEKAFKGEL